MNVYESVRGRGVRTAAYGLDITIETATTAEFLPSEHGGEKLL
jgi:hypothetical protein